MNTKKNLDTSPHASDTATLSSSEAGLIEARRQKAARLREVGEDPFTNDVDLDARSWAVDIRKRYAEALAPPGKELRYLPEEVSKLDSETTWTVFGRLVARRGFGKASFLRIRDQSGELQLFAKKDILGSDFERLTHCDIGDHVQGSGRAMVTRTGELSLELLSLRVITKALRPLPDKWHGLSDVDARYRHRYIDMIANPHVTTTLKARSLVAQGLRRFLDDAGFVEVETPSLHSVIGGAAARPFTTHHNTLDLNLFLRIAPELYLKRLLVGGFERVYEIGRCYRNEGISPRHNPEFTMLEFYYAYATYETLMPMAEQLLRSVDEHLKRQLQATDHASEYEQWLQRRSFTFDEPFARVTMIDAMRSALENSKLPADLIARILASADASISEDERSAEQGQLVRHWAACSERAKSIEWGNLLRALRASESSGDQLMISYEYLAEPFLTVDYRNEAGDKSLPVFIMDYPAEVSPLARRKDDHPEFTDRFELFVDGLELCNAFSELNDPDDQAARFRDQVARKGRGHEETMDFDTDYIHALEQGMPPAAGFGLGLDRLVMMLTAQSSIREVIAFPLLRPES